MKNIQGGFVGVVVVITALAILGAVSYSAYTKNTFGIRAKFDSQYAARINQNTSVQDTTPIQTEATTQQTSKVQNNITVSNNNSLAISTILNCDTNFECIISAANQCQAAIGIYSVTNIQDPVTKGLLHSGTGKIEIKKSGNQCSFQQRGLSQSVTLTQEGRSEWLAQGMTDAEIDEQLNRINQITKKTNGDTATCNGTNAAIASYITDQKNGYVSVGVYELSPDGELNASKVTTSKGYSLTCTIRMSS
jgi:hypothetical protein